MTVEVTIPLDIANVKVLSSTLSADNCLIIQVESQVETLTCGICQQEIACNYGHGKPLELRHMPILGYATYIQLRPRRGQCAVCQSQPTTTQVLSWYQPRSPHTHAYDEYLVKQLVNSTLSDVSLKENVGYDAVAGALNRQVAVRVNWAEITDLHTVGLDEIALRKGHKDYAAIITGRSRQGLLRVLAVLPDRQKKTVRAFLEQIPPVLRSTIKHFTTDMWEGYLNALTEYIAAHAAVTARVVIDRFHVAQHYRDDFDTLRKQELKRLKQELPVETYQQDCQGTLWLLRKNHAALQESERQRLRNLLAHSPQLHQAYTFREELTAIFNQTQTVQEGTRRFVHQLGQKGATQPTGVFHGVYQNTH